MGLMGATITSIQESQQFMGLIIMPMMLPYYLASVFITSSNSIVPRILSFFPLSAPLAVPLRMGFGSVLASFVKAHPGLSLLIFFSNFSNYF